MGEEGLFAIFFCINLVTDILDGLIARVYNMQTELGVKLDSLADMGLYINTLIGGFIFRWDVVEPHILMVLVFAFFYLSMELYTFWKFKKTC